MNENNNGIEHLFPGGVHLIIGVNGLGKTTLLNAMLRVLVGPKDSPKSDDRELGGTQHKLSDWRKPRYFSSRVARGVHEAEVSAEITFGSDTIYISRKLSNLEVTSLLINSIPFPASQDEYENQVTRLSGFADFVDFFSVVKFLLFFLEDRAELIWNPRSQFEIFRILFYDNESSRKAAFHYDESQKADSLYRNLKSALGNIEDKIDILSTDKINDVKAEYKLLKTAIHATNELIQENKSTLSEKQGYLDKLRLQRAKLKREYDQLCFGIEKQQHDLYEQYFPNLDDTVKIFLSHITAKNECLVCGSLEIKNEKLLFKNKDHCLFCHSDLHESKKIGPEKETIQKQIDLLNKQISKIVESISSNETSINGTKVDIENIEQLLDEKLSVYTALEDRLKKVRALLPSDSEDLKELEDSINIYKVRMSSAAKLRDKEHDEYLKILNKNRDVIEDKMKKLEKKFQYYSQHLLSERVFLSSGINKKSIGQSGKKISFPCFNVKMTSGVFTTSPQARESASDVSESQREFIDLAFRFALIDLVAEESNSPSMIVMETPEASLDSMFMFNAAKLFRLYAKKQDGKNVFIASTNLNNSEMIPVLLGDLTAPPEYMQSGIDVILEQPGELVEHEENRPISKEERNKYIINLLKLSAPNSILRANRQLYDLMYERAVYGHTT